MSLFSFLHLFYSCFHLPPLQTERTHIPRCSCFLVCSFHLFPFLWDPGVPGFPFPPFFLLSTSPSQNYLTELFPTQPAPIIDIINLCRRSVSLIPDVLVFFLGFSFHQILIFSPLQNYLWELFPVQPAPIIHSIDCRRRSAPTFLDVLIFFLDSSFHWIYFVFFF